MMVPQLAKALSPPVPTLMIEVHNDPAKASATAHRA